MCMARERSHLATYHVLFVQMCGESVEGHIKEHRYSAYNTAISLKQRRINSIRAAGSFSLRIAMLMAKK